MVFLSIEILPRCVSVTLSGPTLGSVIMISPECVISYVNATGGGCGNNTREGITRISNGTGMLALGPGMVVAPPGKMVAYILCEYVPLPVSQPVLSNVQVPLATVTPA